ncbi:potassium-transporting ATPase subunit KdpC [Pseudorhodoferax sp. Leaf267]|uniref:potassium-transporting ATPase subunit KdpC n=1 Tax=Pseudorhodoferax sp. Leaf267 TaxID=1736316 RepID=UPI00070064DE|nr:potassium-transporting ATPase subunit KdpC [Pseudorhodoferax sp. Leaf267]KQP22695.1 potassium-transporting ATPase subunit C [Pseudorhodoferax sp. Leaf267]
MNTTTAALRPPLDAIQPAGHGVLRGAIVLTILSLLGFGFLYALAGVGIGQALFPAAANGSVIERGGRVVGSALVAQPFVGESYFQPRPSAAGYDPMALAGSNQARTNPELRKRLAETRAAIAQREGVAPDQVPGELFTQSGGGIDPHISPAGAAIQVARVARVRGLAPDVVQRLVAEHTEARQFGVLGAPRVNVLQLNLALDAAKVR